MANKSKNDKLIEDLISDLVQDDEIVIEKYEKEWKFRIVNSRDYLKVLQNSKKYNDDDATRLYCMQIEFLRLALISLNGIILTDMQKDRILNTVSPVVISALYDNYEEIRKARAKELGKKKENYYVEEEANEIAETGNRTIDA